MIKKLIWCAAALGFFVNPASAAQPAKLMNIRPIPFQIILSATVEDYVGESEPFMVEDGAGALIEYVACEYLVSPFNGSTAVQLQLVAEQYEGPDYLEDATIIRPVLREYDPVTPNIVNRWISNDLVSACIGDACETFSNIKFKTLRLRAQRDSVSADTEVAKCLIKGTVF